MEMINLQSYHLLLAEISEEINAGNAKHGHGRLATDDDTCEILVEEIGEYAKACLQQKPDDARYELLQIAAVAINHLIGSGPHRSNL